MRLFSQPQPLAVVVHNGYKVPYQLHCNPAWLVLDTLDEVEVLELDVAMDVDAEDLLLDVVVADEDLLVLELLLVETALLINEDVIAEEVTAEKVLDETLLLETIAEHSDPVTTGFSAEPETVSP